MWRHWLTNIQDWCISRQLWWGHRIPAYYIDFRGEPEGAKSDVTRWVVGRTLDEVKQRAAEKFGRPVEEQPGPGARVGDAPSIGVSTLAPCGGHHCRNL